MKLSRNVIKPLARGGYAARGVVYSIIGVFAILAASGAGRDKDEKQAIVEILTQPFGNLLVWILILGLAGYVIWRLVQSIFDTDQHGFKPKGLAVRAGLLVSAFSYATLALYSLSLLGVFGESDDGGEGAKATIADHIAQTVGSKVMTAALAVIFMGVAGAHWWKAFKRKYEDHFDADDDVMTYVHPISLFGLTARGFVFAVISLLLVYRFLSASTSGNKPPGLSDALNFVSSLPTGVVLLAATGLGLVAFAAYSFAEARWRRINVEDA